LEHAITGGVEAGVEESIVNAPPDYNSDQLFKSNLTFCVVCVFNLQFEKSGFLRRVVLFNANFDAKLKKKHPLYFVVFNKTKLI
jgi:hypothetical protein